MPTLTAEQVAEFDRDGFVVVRGLYDRDEAAAIRDAFMEQGKDGPVEGLSDGQARRFTENDPLAFYPRMMHPHRHEELPVGKVAKDYLLNPRMEPILRTLMGDEPIAAQTMFYFKPPGSRGQALHQDNFYLKVKPGTCMAAWLALDDIDADNGGMTLVAGSHRLDIACPEVANPDESFTSDYVAVPEGLAAKHVDMAPGDALFFQGSVIHGSTPNSSTDRFRRSLIAHYIPSACAEVGEWYKPLMRFDGEVVTKQAATGAGPCGTVVSGPH